MLCYLLLVRPFNTQKHNGIHIYNEIIIFISFVIILIINSVPVNSKLIEVCGYIILGFVFSSLSMTWIILLPGIFKEIVTIVSKALKKDDSKNKSKTIGYEIHSLEVGVEIKERTKHLNSVISQYSKKLK